MVSLSYGVLPKPAARTAADGEISRKHAIAAFASADAGTAGAATIDWLEWRSIDSAAEDLVWKARTGARIVVTLALSWCRGFETGIAFVPCARGQRMYSPCPNVMGQEWRIVEHAAALYEQSLCERADRPRTAAVRASFAAARPYPSEEASVFDAKRTATGRARSARPASAV
jgi:hypothetical protein